MNDMLKSKEESMEIFKHAREKKIQMIEQTIDSWGKQK